MQVGTPPRPFKVLTDRYSSLYISLPELSLIDNAAVLRTFGSLPPHVEFVESTNSSARDFPPRSEHPTRLSRSLTEQGKLLV
jgi:hypothetical protein